MSPSAPNPFNARWTATGNNLCLGHWEISHLGKPLALHTQQRDHDMGTHGIYSYIFPDDEDFAEGLDEDAWIKANAGWLTELFRRTDIPADAAHMRWFFQAVNPHDWRCGSCGGCL